MTKKEDSETRYFIDLDLQTRTILRWDHDQRHKLAGQALALPSYHRIFITRGQYNKLAEHADLLGEAGSADTRTRSG